MLSGQPDSDTARDARRRAAGHRGRRPGALNGCTGRRLRLARRHRRRRHDRGRRRDRRDGRRGPAAATTATISTARPTAVGGRPPVVRGPAGRPPQRPPHGASPAPQPRRRAGDRRRPRRPADEAPGQAPAARRHRGDRPRGPRPGGRRERSSTRLRRRWSTPRPSISGRYPNLGPLLLRQAGIPLVDDVGVRGHGVDPRGCADHESTATGSWSAARSWPPASARPSPTVDAAIEVARRQHRRRARALRREHARVPPRRERTSSSTHARHARRARRHRGPPRAHRRAGHRLQGRPRRSCQQRATCRTSGPCSSASTAAPTRCSRSAASPTSSSATSTRCPSGALRCGAELSCTATPTAARPGASASTSWACRTRCSRRRAPARTSPCCSPTRRAPS